MFNRYKTEGVFLKIEDRGESNKFLTCYTKDFGKIRIFAKSIRKKESKLRFGAEVSILNEIEFIEGRNYRTLTDIRIINNFKVIRKDLTKIFFAYKACEDLNELTKEEQKEERIWVLLKEFLEDLNQEKSFFEFSLYFRFIWKLFSFLGYGPELYNCVSCSKKIEKEPFYFSFENGGVVGSCCFNNQENICLIEKNEIKFLRILLKESKEIALKLKIDSQTKNNLKNLTEKYLNHLV